MNLSLPTSLLNLAKTILLFLPTLVFGQQNLTTPQVSQAATVTQQVGLSTITITYHSPLANGRKILGELVPYDAVWRAGANENTTIELSTDCKVEGKSLTAGKYGLHMIPKQNEWTIIFSKNSAAWGSFFYKDSEDALRVTVKAQTAPAQNWLSYSFADPKAESAVVQLHWDQFMVPFKVTFDVPEIAYQSMSKELTGLGGFFWQGYNQGAQYLYRNKIHMDQASQWADKSIEIQKTFPNLQLKAKMLDAKGNKEMAANLRTESLTLGDEAQINAYGYELIAAKNYAEANQIFAMNVKKFPNSWNAYDSLGEAQIEQGNKKDGLANYKKALSKAPDAQKSRIEGIIKHIEAK